MQVLGRDAVGALPCAALQLPSCDEGRHQLPLCRGVLLPRPCLAKCVRTPRDRCQSETEGGVVAQRSVAQWLKQALRRSEALRIQRRLTATLRRKPQMAFSDPESWFCWNLREVSESKAFIGSHFEQLLASPSLRSLPSQLSLPCGLVRGSAENLKLSRQNSEAALQACLLPDLECLDHGVFTLPRLLLLRS